jgi:hypothetical protein
VNHPGEQALFAASPSWELPPLRFQKEHQISDYSDDESMTPIRKAVDTWKNLWNHVFGIQ